MNKSILLLLLAFVSSTSLADWTVETESDVMSDDGQKMGIARSDAVYPNKKQSEPYTDMKATLQYECWSHHGGLSLFYLQFNKMSLGENLALLSVPTKFDAEKNRIMDFVIHGGDLAKIMLAPKSLSALGLFAENPMDWFRGEVITRNTVKLQVFHHAPDGGLIIFEFDLDGAKEAILEADNYCGLNHAAQKKETKKSNRRNSENVYDK